MTENKQKHKKRESNKVSIVGPSNTGNNSSKKKHKDIKSIILNHLSNYKKELKDEKHVTFRPLSVPMDSLTGIPLGMEVVAKETKAQDTPEEKIQRDQVTQYVQQLMENVKVDGERIVVVNVNTPAIDVDKNFDSEQLQFIENDIFSKIEHQLGVNFSDEVEEQWDTAFKTMMDIVKAEKKKQN